MKPRRHVTTSCLYRETVRVVGAISLLGVAGCDGHSADRPQGWTELTHGKNAPPNYELLFDTTVVHQIEITIAASDYQTMQDDLAELLGGIGLGGDRAPSEDANAEMLAACIHLMAGDACEVELDGQLMSGTCVALGSDLACIVKEEVGPGGGDGNLIGGDPTYVAVEVGYDGHTWWHVGMRYKGNSSLALLFRGGNGKLPFRLNFDKFEDEFPEIDDQHFYGFDKLTFSANWSDDSQIRECFVAELFREGGIQAARCAFYRVFVDVGEGPEYWGVYSLIEDPSDGAMLDSQFGERGGNLYKPEGEGADWTHFSTEGFVKKTNEGEADWSDVEAAIAALHADRSDALTWRQNLEATFDVDHFLTWLAINTAIQNWDSYGSMAHNYYLYADPAVSGKLVWFPCDHNLAMMAGMGGGGLGSFGTAQDPASEVFHVDAGTAWPLISFLLADDVYSARYRERLVDALGGLFDLDLGPARMREMHTLIAPYVVGPDGERPSHTTISSEAAFLEAIEGVGGLAEHVQQRHTLVLEALAATP